MRTVFYFIVALLAISCKQEEKVKVIRNGKVVEINASEVKNLGKHERVLPADGKYPVMAFESTEHDFGNIEQSEKVTYEFAFKNTGEADLLISRAVGSCGCTVPEYPKENIKPGESGKIKVSFNPAGKHGNQHKSVTLSTNTESGVEKLEIKASINPASGTNMQPVATPNK